MQIRIVDPTTWPLWPKNTRIAIIEVGSPVRSLTMRIGRIVAVGERCTLVSPGEAGGHPVMFGCDDGIEVEVDGKPYWIVDETAVIATLRD